MIEEDMVARATSDAAILALVPASAFYPVEAPPDAAGRYFVYRRADTEPADTLDDAKSVHSIVFVIEAHAPSYEEACTMAATLKPVLDGWRADAPLSIMSMTFAGEHDGAGDYDEAQRRRRSFCRETVFVALVRA